MSSRPTSLADNLQRVAQQRTWDTPPTPTDVYNVASDYVGYHRSHKFQIAKYDAIVDGRWNTVWPDGSITQNMPKVAEYISSDTEDLAGLVAGPEPSIVVPQKNDEPANVENALRRQQILYTLARINRMKRLRHKTAIDLVSTGLACWVVWPDYNSGYARIGRKDPRIVYPDPSLDDPTEVTSVVVRYMTKTRLLVAMYPHLRNQLFTDHEIRRGDDVSSNEEAEVIEFHDKDWSIKIVHRGPKDARYKGRDILLAQVPNYAYCPLALITYRDSADGRFRGQFDKAIPPLGTANKLMELHLAQAADEIFAEKIVKGQFENPEDVGPGAVLYTMDYQAAIDRAKTAASSPQMYNDVRMLLDASREAAGIPQGRHGAVDQNIISAQGINALMGKYATAVTGYQTLEADLEERAYGLALCVEEKYLGYDDAGKPRTKELSGIAGGRSFEGTYVPVEDIAGQYEARVSYPAGSSMDSYNRGIQAIQQVNYRLISRRKAMELSDTVEDIDSMESEIFREGLIDAFMATLADPAATDLFTKADAVAMLQKGKTPSEVIMAIRDQMAAAQEAAAAEAQAQASLVGAAPTGAGAEVAPTAVPAEQMGPLPALPGRSY